jgi:hypothetical protein
VIRVWASKAEPVAAQALDGWNNLIQVLLLDAALNDIGAIGGRTPFKIVLVLNIGPVQ